MDQEQFLKHANWRWRVRKVFAYLAWLKLPFTMRRYRLLSSPPLEKFVIKRPQLVLSWSYKALTLHSEYFFEPIISRAA